MNRVLSLLSRYLLRQNLLYMTLCVVLGTVVYLLSDVFDRLDDFLEAGLGITTVLGYFLMKIPLIFAQIMPAVFLVALIVQLGILTRSRELLALQTGGISYGKLTLFFVCYALVWSGVQLGFSQAFGVYAEQATSRIWAEEVRDRKLEREQLEDMWFREGPYIVHFRTVNLSTGQGRDLTIYQLSEDRSQVVWIFEAEHFEVKPEEWTLHEASVFSPGEFRTRVFPVVHLYLNQDLSAFRAVNPSRDPEQLPLWSLAKAIQNLRTTGSNVESLRTIWHSKLAYAFSIMTMALIALAVTSFGRNIYVNVIASLTVTFFFYGFYIIGLTLGQKGMVPPMLGAWLGNAIFSMAAVSRLIWVVSKD